MELTSTSFKSGEAIPAEFAFCIADAQTHATLASNRNPHLRWTNVPVGVRSFAVIFHDVDVPTKPDDVNQDDREVPADLPRADFFHWLVADLPADLTEISAGAFADGVMARGQQVAKGPYGSHQGCNDYTSWFAGDPDMEGNYFGYDGPCPPWNDSIIHRYLFTVYALDLESLDLPTGYRGAVLRDAMAGHILGQASMTGSYTLNPRLVG